MYWATAMASSIPPVPCVGGALACLQLCCVHETYELQRKKTVDACCINLQSSILVVTQFNYFEK